MMSASWPAQLLFLVIPRTKAKLSVFKKMLPTKFPDGTKHGVWQDRVKDGTAEFRSEQTRLR
jgi:hypothetical protein